MYRGSPQEGSPPTPLIVLSDFRFRGSIRNTERTGQDTPEIIILIDEEDIGNVCPTKIAREQGWH